MYILATFPQRARGQKREERPLEVSVHMSSSSSLTAESQERIGTRVQRSGPDPRSAHDSWLMRDTGQITAPVLWL